MDYKPTNILSTGFNTETNKQPITSSQQAKQISYKYITTFNDSLEDLMMEQREQM